MLDPTFVSTLLGFVPQLALALVVVFVVRDLQTRNALQIKDLLDQAEKVRSEARQDFINALKDERTERQSDTMLWQQKLDALAQLVSTTNALVAQHDTQAREYIQRNDKGAGK